MAPVPMPLELSAIENTVPEPRRSGRVRSSTQRLESTAQAAVSATKTSMKGKRTDPTHDDTSNQHQHQHTQTIHAQPRAAKNNSKATTKRVANNKSIQSDDAYAKPTNKASSAQQAKNVIDLTEDDEATSSKKPKKAKSGKGEEKRLKP